jgi:Chemotaxis response regulator containing a CheY-like receiver domain and a methylesterase domain
MTADMIRVIVVDDSNFMVNVIKNILESDKGIRVIGTAKSGTEAIEKIKELKPDVVTLDVLMPGMNGLEALREIMRDCPTRVVMISAADKESADIVIRSLEEGAVSFISKPQGPISPHMKRIASKIIDKVKTASSVDIEKLKNRKRREKKLMQKGSTGKARLELQ